MFEEHRRAPEISITAGPGGLRVATPYDAAFLAAFKQLVPHSARAWQKPYWVIEPQYGAQVAELAYTFFGVRPALPATQATPVAPEVRMIELHYLGRCKARGDGVSSAYGTTDRGTTWSVVFPETVLRAHFGAQDQKPDTPETLYGVLGVPARASADDLKIAYHRMARQWHPDVCREPDATARFQAIQHAYAILKEAQTRKRYDAGLALEASLASTKRQPGWGSGDNAASIEYRAPLRCGLLLCEGQAKLGRFVVSKISDWADIVDRQGRTLVSSWSVENEAVKMDWV